MPNAPHASFPSSARAPSSVRRPGITLHRSGRSLLLAVFLLAVAPGLLLADACGDGLIDRVQARYQSLKGFEGRFSQEDHQTDGRVIKAAGEIAYLKPGRMRWAYQTPDEQLLVTDGKTVWLHDPLLDNVTVQPLGDLTQGTPLAFLLGAGNLREDFACRDFSTPPPADGLAYLELVPRKPIPALDHIVLGAVKGTALIAALGMVDSQGNRRWVRFFDLILDPALDPAQFVFEITPGMEVIEK